MLAKQRLCETISDHPLHCPAPQQWRMWCANCVADLSGGILPMAALRAMPASLLPASECSRVVREAGDAPVASGLLAASEKMQCLLGLARLVAE